MATANAEFDPAIGLQRRESAGKEPLKLRRPNANGKQRAAVKSVLLIDGNARIDEFNAPVQRLSPEQCCSGRHSTMITTEKGTHEESKTISSFPALFAKLSRLYLFIELGSIIAFSSCSVVISSRKPLPCLSDLSSERGPFIWSRSK
jgi:hypothetical protein